MYTVCALINRVSIGAIALQSVLLDNVNCDTYMYS